MQILTKSNFAQLRSASTKPVLLTALATGAAGMAAVASPLTSVPARLAAERPVALLAPFTAQRPRANVKATIRIPLPPPTIMPATAMPATAPDRSGLHSPSSTDLPRAVAGEAQLAPSAAPDFEPLSSRNALEAPASAMPLPQAVQLSLPQPALVEPVLAAAAPPAADRETTAMPSAELKAMMVSVAATRGDLAGSETMGPTSQLPDTPGLARDEGPVAKPQRSALEGEGPSAISRYSQTDRGIEFEVAAVVNGAPAGKVPLLIADSENIAVRLGDVLALIEPLMDKAEYDSLSAAKGAGEFVTFNSLRKSGIAVQFDSKDRLILGKS